MKVLGRFALLFGVLAFLWFAGIVIPLQIHGDEQAVEGRELEFGVDAVIANLSVRPLTPTLSRKTPNYLENFNYSFETEEHWYVNKQDGCSYFRPHMAYHRQRSAQIENNNGSLSCYWRLKTQEPANLSLAAGHHYYFSARIRTDLLGDGAEAYVLLRVWDMDGKGYRFSSTKVTTNTAESGQENEWVEVYGVAEIPSEPERARIECRLDEEGHAWFDYLFLGLDVALELTKTVYPDPVAPGDFLTYTITYSNTGSEPAQDVVIREYLYNLDPDVRFVSSVPEPDNPPLNDEWEIGTLTTTNGSIVAVVEVVSDTQKAFLTNLARMKSKNHINAFSPVSLTLFTSTTVDIIGDGCAIYILPPPLEESAPSPGTVPLSHEVQNCGAITTDITVTVEPPHGWIVSPSVKSINDLPPSQTEKVETEIIVPPDVPVGTEKAIRWIASAACETDVRAQITDFVQIRDTTIFLPAAMKQYDPPCLDPIGDPCGGQDPYEPNNIYCSAGTSLMSDVSLEAPLCSLADQDDYYYVDVTIAGTLEIWLKDLPKDYDLYLYYADNCEDFVAKSDYYELCDDYISYPVPVDKLGRYYIRVRSYEGNYSLEPYTLLATYPLPESSE